MGVTVREKIKGSGQWWVFLRDKEHGIRRSRRMPSKKEALEVARQIQARMLLGQYDFNDSKEMPKFSEYARKWIENTVPATCKESTQREYNLLLKKHVLPIFENHDIAAIKRQQIKEFLQSKINEGYSISTVKHMKNAISGILNIAFDAEIIPANPAHNIGKIFNNRQPKANIDPLTREELNILLNTFYEDFPAHYPLVLTLARTGMRFGEAIALQWGDIDFNGHFIIIQRGVTRGKSGTTKSGKSRRVDMSDQLTETLRELKEKRFGIITGIKGNVLSIEQADQSEYIFTNAAGGFIDNHHWRYRVFNKALSKAGLRHIRIHDLRHTYASLLIQAGESLAYIRDQLGHHSISITVDIYGHLVPGANRDAVNKLDDRIQSKKPIFEML